LLDFSHLLVDIGSVNRQLLLCEVDDLLLIVDKGHLAGLEDIDVSFLVLLAVDFDVVKL
jgi:hypothetical protein